MASRFIDHRGEPRFPLEAIPARIQIDAAWLPARVLDISTSGMKLEVRNYLPVHSEVTVCFNSIIALGQIRYCRRNCNESFDLGFQLEEVINTV
jgi:hypothetical protein